MSNSLSNTLKIRDLAREFLPNAIKLYLLSKHYREELSYSKTCLKKYGPAIDKLITESVISEKELRFVLVTVTRFLQNFKHT